MKCLFIARTVESKWHCHFLDCGVSEILYKLGPLLELFSLFVGNQDFWAVPLFYEGQHDDVLHLILWPCAIDNHK